MALMPQFRCRACQATYPERNPDGAPHHHACCPTMHNAEREIVPRTVIRDENFTFDRRGHMSGIRAEGLGVECISGEGLAEPKYISELKARLAKEEAADE
jgi:hypothetical protein